MLYAYFWESPDNSLSGRLWRPERPYTYFIWLSACLKYELKNPLSFIRTRKPHFSGHNQASFMTNSHILGHLDVVGTWSPLKHFCLRVRRFTLNTAHSRHFLLTVKTNISLQSAIFGESSIRYSYYQIPDGLLFSKTCPLLFPKSNGQIRAPASPWRREKKRITDEIDNLDENINQYRVLNITTLVTRDIDNRNKLTDELHRVGSEKEKLQKANAEYLEKLTSALNSDKEILHQEYLSACTSQDTRKRNRLQTEILFIMKEGNTIDGKLEHSIDEDTDDLYKKFRIEELNNIGREITGYRCEAPFCAKDIQVKGRSTIGCEAQLRTRFFVKAMKEQTNNFSCFMAKRLELFKKTFIVNL